MKTFVNVCPIGCTKQFFMHPFTSPSQLYQLLRPAIKTRSNALSYYALYFNPSTDTRPVQCLLRESNHLTGVHHAFLFVGTLPLCNRLRFIAKRRGYLQAMYGPWPANLPSRSCKYYRSFNIYTLFYIQLQLHVQNLS